MSFAGLRKTNYSRRYRPSAYSRSSSVRSLYRYVRLACPSTYCTPTYYLPYIYAGKLTNGQKFDSSFDRNQPLQFQVGVGQVIKGWDEGVLTMKVGEKSVLTCSPDYAYGARGFPPAIPPNSTLVFDVELVSID